MAMISDSSPCLRCPKAEAGGWCYAPCMAYANWYRMAWDRTVEPFRRLGRMETPQAPPEGDASSPFRGASGGGPADGMPPPPLCGSPPLSGAALEEGGDGE